MKVKSLFFNAFPFYSTDMRVNRATHRARLWSNRILKICDFSCRMLNDTHTLAPSIRSWANLTISNDGAHADKFIGRTFFSDSNNVKYRLQKSISNYFIPFTTKGQNNMFRLFFEFFSLSLSTLFYLFICLFGIQRLEQFYLGHAKVLEEGLNTEVVLDYLFSLYKGIHALHSLLLFFPSLWIVC